MKRRFLRWLWRALGESEGVPLRFVWTWPAWIDGCLEWPSFVATERGGTKFVTLVWNRARFRCMRLL